jgi:hypothetical protein
MECCQLQCALDLLQLNETAQFSVTHLTLPVIDDNLHYSLKTSLISIDYSLIEPTALPATYPNAVLI